MVRNRYLKGEVKSRVCIREDACRGEPIDSVGGVKFFKIQNQILL